MSKIDKLIKRLLSMPKDFTFDELIQVMSYFGFYILKPGKTSGSRTQFSNGFEHFKIHKPHPRKILKTYQLIDVISFLKNGGYL